MRKRRKNERQKCCSAALALLILCSWMVSSIIVYGFDMSGMDSFDTGGFVGIGVFVGADVSVSPSAGVLTVFASSSMVVPGFSFSWISGS